MRPREPSTTRDAAYLALCTPQAAYDWLRTRPVDMSRWEWPQTPDNAHLLEYILLRRNDPLITLGLAEFGRSRTVLGRIFQGAPPSVRAVACGNASLFFGSNIDTPSRQRLVDQILRTATTNDPADA